MDLFYIFFNYEEFDRNQVEKNCDNDINIYWCSVLIPKRIIEQPRNICSYHIREKTQFMMNEFNVNKSQYPRPS